MQNIQGLFLPISWDSLQALYALFIIFGRDPA